MLTMLLVLYTSTKTTFVRAKDPIVIDLSMKGK